MTILSLDSPRGPRSGKSLKLALVAGAVAAIVAVASTLAANININSGPVEFGQGVAQTTACSGDDAITLTPQSTFVNSATDANFYFTSLSVSGIPSSCIDTNFKFSAYGETGTALTLTECNDDGGFAPVVFFTGDEETDQTEQSSDDMYSNVYDATSTGFSLTWHSVEECVSSVLASQVYKVTVETSVGDAPVPDIGDYVVDYAPGATVFDPTPLFSLDAATSSPEGSVWSDTNTSSSLTLSADLVKSTAETDHVDFGSVSGIAELGNALNGKDRLTVEMWIKFNNPGTRWSSRPFSFGRSGNEIQVRGYGLFFHDLSLGINTYDDDVLGFPTASIDGSWRHIVWVASTGGRYTQKIYVDGVLQQLTRSLTLVEDTILRTNSSNGQIGVNLQNMGQSSNLKVGAINIYAGEMPQVSAAGQNMFFQSRLT
jgi:hypothetical protein